MGVMPVLAELRAVAVAEVYCLAPKLSEFCRERDLLACRLLSMTQPTWLSTGGFWLWRVRRLKGAPGSADLASFTTG